MSPEPIDAPVVESAVKSRRVSEFFKNLTQKARERRPLAQYPTAVPRWAARGQAKEEPEEAKPTTAITYPEAIKVEEPEREEALAAPGAPSIFDVEPRTLAEEVSSAVIEPDAQGGFSWWNEAEAIAEGERVDPPTYSSILVAIIHARSGGDPEYRFGNAAGLFGMTVAEKPYVESFLRETGQIEADELMSAPAFQEWVQDPENQLQFFGPLVASHIKRATEAGIGGPDLAETVGKQLEFPGSRVLRAGAYATAYDTVAEIALQHVWKTTDGELPEDVAKKAGIFHTDGRTAGGEPSGLPPIKGGVPTREEDITPRLVTTAEGKPFEAGRERTGFEKWIIDPVSKLYRTPMQWFGVLHDSSPGGEALAEAGAVVMDRVVSPIGASISVATAPFFAVAGFLGKNTSNSDSIWAQLGQKWEGGRKALVSRVERTGEIWTPDLPADAAEGEGVISYLDAKMDEVNDHFGTPRLVSGGVGAVAGGVLGGTFLGPLGAIGGAFLGGLTTTSLATPGGLREPSLLTVLTPGSEDWTEEETKRRLADGRDFSYTWMFDQTAKEGYMKDKAAVLQDINDRRAMDGLPARQLNYHEIDELKLVWENPDTEMVGSILLDLGWFIPAKVMKALFWPFRQVGKGAWWTTKAAFSQVPGMRWLLTEAVGNQSIKAGDLYVGVIKELTQALERWVMEYPGAKGTLDDFLRLQTGETVVDSGGLLEAVKLFFERGHVVTPDGRIVELATESGKMLANQMRHFLGIAADVPLGAWEEMSVLGGRIKRPSLLSGAHGRGTLRWQRLGRSVLPRMLNSMKIFQHNAAWKEDMVGTFIKTLEGHAQDLSQTAGWLERAPSEKVAEILQLFKNVNVVPEFKMRHGVPQLIHGQRQIYNWVSGEIEVIDRVNPLTMAGPNYLRRLWIEANLSARPGFTVRNVIDSFYRALVYGGPGMLFEDLDSIIKNTPLAEEALSSFAGWEVAGTGRAIWEGKKSLPKPWQLKEWIKALREVTRRVEMAGRPTSAIRRFPWPIGGGPTGLKGNIKTPLGDINLTYSTFVEMMRDWNEAFEVMLRIRMYNKFYHEIFDNMWEWYKKSVQTRSSLTPATRAIVDQILGRKITRTAQINAFLKEVFEEKGYRVDLDIPRRVQSIARGTQQQADAGWRRTSEVYVKEVQDRIYDLYLKRGGKITPDDIVELFDELEKGLDTKFAAEMVQVDDMKRATPRKPPSAAEVAEEVQKGTDLKGSSTPGVGDVGNEKATVRRPPPDEADTFTARPGEDFFHVHPEGKMHEVGTQWNTRQLAAKTYVKERVEKLNNLGGARVIDGKQQKELLAAWWITKNYKDFFPRLGGTPITVRYTSKILKVPSPRVVKGTGEIRGAAWQAKRDIDAMMDLRLSQAIDEIEALILNGEQAAAKERLNALSTTRGWFNLIFGEEGVGWKVHKGPFAPGQEALEGVPTMVHFKVYVDPKTGNIVLDPSEGMFLRPTVEWKPQWDASVEDKYALTELVSGKVTKQASSKSFRVIEGQKVPAKTSQGGFATYQGKSITKYELANDGLKKIDAKGDDAWVVADDGTVGVGTKRVNVTELDSTTPELNQAVKNSLAGDAGVPVTQTVDQEIAAAGGIPKVNRQGTTTEGLPFPVTKSSTRVEVARKALDARASGEWIRSTRVPSIDELSPDFGPSWAEEEIAQKLDDLIANIRKSHGDEIADVAQEYRLARDAVRQERAHLGLDFDNRSRVASAEAQEAAARAEDPLWPMRGIDQSGAAMEFERRAQRMENYELQEAIDHLTEFKAAVTRQGLPQKFNPTDQIKLDEYLKEVAKRNELVNPIKRSVASGNQAALQRVVPGEGFEDIVKEREVVRAALIRAPNDMETITHYADVGYKDFETFFRPGGTLNELAVVLPDTYGVPLLPDAGKARFVRDAVTGIDSKASKVSASNPTGDVVYINYKDPAWREKANKKTWEELEEWGRLWGIGPEAITLQSGAAKVEGVGGKEMLVDRLVAENDLRLLLERYSIEETEGWGLRTVPDEATMEELTDIFRRIYPGASSEEFSPLVIALSLVQHGSDVSEIRLLDLGQRNWVNAVRRVVSDPSLPNPGAQRLEQALEIEADRVSRVGAEAGSAGLSRQWIPHDVPQDSVLADAFGALELVRDDLVSPEMIERQGWRPQLRENGKYEMFPDGGSAVARINELVSESGDDLIADRLGIAKIIDSADPTDPPRYLIMSLPPDPLMPPYEMDMVEWMVWFRNNLSPSFLEEHGLLGIPLEQAQDLSDLISRLRNTRSWTVPIFKSPNQERIWGIVQENRRRTLLAALERNFPVPKHNMKEFPELERTRWKVMDRGQENLQKVTLRRHGKDKQQINWRGLRSWIDQMEYLLDIKGGVGEKAKKWYLDSPDSAYKYDLDLEKGTIKNPPRMVELIRKLHTDVIGFEKNQQTLTDALSAVNKYRGTQINLFEDSINEALLQATETSGKTSDAWRAVARDLRQADTEARNIQMAIQSQLSVLGQPYRDSIAVYQKTWEKFFTGDTAVGYVPGRASRVGRKGGRSRKQQPTYPQMEHILAKLKEMATKTDLPEFEVLQAWVIAELATGSSFRGGYLRMAKWGWLDIDDVSNARLKLIRVDAYRKDYGGTAPISISKEAAEALTKLKRRMMSDNYGPKGFEDITIHTIDNTPIFAHFHQGKVIPMTQDKMTKTVRGTAGDDFWGLSEEALAPRRAELEAELAYENLVWPKDGNGEPVKRLKLHDFRRFAGAKLWYSMPVPDIDIVAEYMMHSNKQVTVKNYLEQMGVSSADLIASFGRSRTARSSEELITLGLADDYLKAAEQVAEAEVNQRVKQLKQLEPLMETDHPNFPGRLDEITEQWQAFVDSAAGKKYGKDNLEVTELVKNLNANPVLKKKLFEQAARRSMAKGNDEEIIKRMHKAIARKYRAERVALLKNPERLRAPKWDDVIRKVLGEFEERLSRPIPDVPPEYFFDESVPFKVFKLIDEEGRVWGDFASPYRTDANDAAVLVKQKGANVTVKEFTESVDQWERHFPDFAKWRSFMWNDALDESGQLIREKILKHPDYRPIIERIEARNHWSPAAHQAGLKEFHPTQPGPLSWDSYNKDLYEKGLLLYDSNTRMPTRVTPDKDMQDALALAREHVEDWLTQIQKNQSIKNTASLVKYDGKVYVMTGPGSMYELVPKSEYIKAEGEKAFVKAHEWLPGHPRGYTGVTVKYKGEGDKNAVEYVMGENVHVYYPEEMLEDIIKVRTWLHDPVLGSTVLIRDGAEVSEATYAIIDVRDPVKAYDLAPDRKGLIKNEGFPKYLRRQEAAADAEERLRLLAQTMQPEYVINEKAVKGQGVPTLNRDKIAYDGSGRLLALEWAEEAARTASDPRMAYVWNSYQRYLADNIGAYGIPVEALKKGDKRSVLVRILNKDLNDYQAMRFVDRSNLPTGIDAAAISNFAEVIADDINIIRGAAEDLGLGPWYRHRVGVEGEAHVIKAGRDFGDLIEELYSRELHGSEGRLRGTGIRPGTVPGGSLEMDVPPFFRDRVARSILAQLFDDETTAHQIAQVFADTPDVHIVNSVGAILNNYSGFLHTKNIIAGHAPKKGLAKAASEKNKRIEAMAKEYYGLLDDMAFAISFISNIKPLFPNRTLTEIIEAMAKGDVHSQFKMLFVERPRLYDTLDFIGRFGKEPEPLSDVFVTYMSEYAHKVNTAGFNTTPEEALRNAIKVNIPEDGYVAGQRTTGVDNLRIAIQARQDVLGRKIFGDIPVGDSAAHLRYGELSAGRLKDEAIPPEEFNEDVIRHLFGFLGVYRHFPSPEDTQWYDDIVSAIQKLGEDPQAGKRFWRNLKQKDYARIIATASELLDENVRLLDNEILAIINRYPELRPLVEGVKEMPVPAYQSLADLAGTEQGMQIVLEAAARHIGERATQLVSDGLSYDMRVALGWLEKWLPEGNAVFLTTTMKNGPMDILPYSMISKYHELVDHAILNAGGLSKFPAGKYHRWNDGLQRFDWTDEGLRFRDDLKKLVLAGQEAHAWKHLGGVPDVLDPQGVTAVAQAINNFTYLVWGRDDIAARNVAPGVARNPIFINGRQVQQDRVSGAMNKAHAIEDVLNNLVMSGEGTIDNPGLGMFVDGSAQYKIIKETDGLRLWNVGPKVPSPQEGVINLNRYHYGAVIQKYNQHNLIPVADLSAKQIVKMTGARADNVDDLVKLINHNLRVFHQEMMTSYKNLSDANRKIMERLVPTDALQFTKNSEIAEPLITEMRDYVKAGRVRPQDLGEIYNLPCP